MESGFVDWNAELVYFTKMAFIFIIFKSRLIMRATKNASFDADVLS